MLYDASHAAGTAHNIAVSPVSPSTGYAPPNLSFLVTDLAGFTIFTGDASQILANYTGIINQAGNRSDGLSGNVNWTPNLVYGPGFQQISFANLTEFQNFLTRTVNGGPTVKPVAPSASSFAPFVNATFQRILGRPADSAALNEYTAALANGSLTTAQFVAEVATSTEAINDIKGLYSEELAALIHRIPGIRWRASRKLLILFMDWVSTPVHSPDHTEPRPPCPTL